MRHLRAASVRRAALTGLLLGAAVSFLTAGQAAAPALAASSVTVTGAGSSYAAVAILQWVGQVEQLYGDNINYSTSSSVIGLNDFAQGQVNFAASEIGYSTGQANYTPPAGEAYQYMPDVAGAECLMYNLDDQTQTAITNLKLTPTLIFQIFTGQIKQWNAPAIAAINPGVLLPSTPIVVVYRADASGDNYIFSDYLYTLLSGPWNQFTAALGAPPGPAALWPTPSSGTIVGPYNYSNWISQTGSDNASSYVTGTPDTITYVETAYALRNHMPCANVENQSGNFLQPSEIGDAVALTHDQLAPDLEQNLTNVFTAPETDAYPISAYSYIITEEGEMQPQIGQVMGQFVRFAACQGQQSAALLGYSPIPPNLVADDFSAIGRMNGATNPGTPTASDCPNPYLTGQLTIPGTTNPNPVTTPTTAPGPTTSGTSPTGESPSASGPSPAQGSQTQNGSGVQGPSNQQAAGQEGANGQAGTVGTSSKAVNSGSKVLASGTDLPPAPVDLGQARGTALLSAADEFLNTPGPTAQIVGWTFVFVLLLAAAPVVAIIRRRRKREVPS